VDDVARLIQAFGSLAGTDDADGFAKVEIILGLEDHVSDTRVLELFASVIADPAEYDLARIECLKILRLWPPDLAADRRKLGPTIAAVLSADEDHLVRLYAAGSLGPYVDDSVVFDALTVAVIHDDDIDIRHNALASVEEAGPGERAIALLRRLADDPLLGSSARRTLRAWT
jgi:hypothetical protein